MRSPSARCLINAVDIYVGTEGRDLNAGPKEIHPATPTFAGVPCTVQVGAYREEPATDADGQDRVTQLLEYRIMFGQNYAVTARDKIIYVDSSGISHTLFVQAQRDEAGRGAAFTIRADERL